MIELPGSFSGRCSSPSPQRGPEASQRTSLAIFVSATASVFSAPCALTSGSWDASAANRFAAQRSGSPVSAARRAATRSPNCGCVFSPVPTAVPPTASSCSGPRHAPIAWSAWSSWATQPDISWPRVTGVASCRCVRPIFTMPAYAEALAASVARSARSAGCSSYVALPAAATCIAVGKMSLVDCPRLTWSFGCTRRCLPRPPPSSSEARLASTSFMFMLVWVPEPVCQTESGNASGCWPASTSSAACAIAAAMGASSRLSSPLTWAHARLTRASAISSAWGMRSVEMWKCSSERCVCAPHRAVAGTATSPIESVSILAASSIARSPSRTLECHHAVDQRTRQAVRDAHDPGRAVAGGSKSTLLNLIAGLESPDAGRIELAATDLAALDDDARTRLRRQAIGFVFQAFHIIPHLTALENTVLPLVLQGVGVRERVARAHRMLEAVGLGDRSQSMPRELSGGELQRVAIARALVHRPALVLADEPTGNLDPDTAQSVLALLAASARADNAATIVVTHSEAAAQTADRVLRLARGQLATAPALRAAAP